MLCSLSDSTLKQYNVSLKSWWQFCDSNNIAYLETNITHVLSFLTEQFKNGNSYGTLNTHRSALSLLLGSEIGTNDCVKRLLKAVYKRKPSLPKYNGTWDPQRVLDFISTWYPNTSLNLEKLTKKVVILLAICTAHRVQTFSLIKIQNIKVSSNGIQIGITDVIKTSAPDRDQPVLNLPFFHEKPSICPASAISDYITATENLRCNSLDSLLLTYKKPHRPASSQTISRWIKQVLSESGIDVTIFGAHSARHAATSAARRAGASIDNIRRTAGWTATSNTFARFYNRPILDTNDFARTVCLEPRL